MSAWLFMVHASLCAYVLMSMLWLSPAFLSMRLIRRKKSEDEDDLLVYVEAGTRVSSVGWALLLLITGASIGLLIVVGSMVLLGVFAVGCSIVPWYHIRLCREHPVPASLIMWSGGAIVVAIYHHYVEFMFLPLAAWALGVAALSALLRTVPKNLRKKQPERADAVPAES